MADFFADLFTFRSDWHLGWFLVSLAMLVAYLVISLSETADIRRRGRHSRETALGFAKMFMLFHFVSAVLAALNSALAFMPEAVMSADCVWFNALMAVIYRVACQLEMRAARRLRGQDQPHDSDG